MGKTLRRYLARELALAFLAGRRWWPRYAVPGVLLAGVAVAALQGRMQWGRVAFAAAGRSLLQAALPASSAPTHALDGRARPAGRGGT